MEFKIVEKLITKKLELRETITDESIIDSIILSTEQRATIQKELDLTVSQFNNLLSSIRKKKVIIDNKLNKVLIPNFNLKDTYFKYTTIFTIHE